jgi:hypothetical protein
MTRTILLLGMGAMLGITSRPLRAQMQGAQLGPTPIGIAELRPGIPPSDGELTPAVRAHLARGDSLTGLQRYPEAVQEYRRAAQIARAEGHLPSLTLWHLASARFYGGDPRRAAQVLDELRAEAAGFGELGVEAVALYNAAWLSGKAGRGRDAAAKVAQLEKLLRSPYMPADVRTFLAGRLSTRNRLAVKQ